MSTGQAIVSYFSLKAASPAIDLVLFVSYFSIFRLYCLMSEDFRRTLMSVWCCVQHCRTVQLNYIGDHVTVVLKKSTASTLLSMEERASADCSPVLIEKNGKGTEEKLLFD